MQKNDMARRTFLGSAAAGVVALGAVGAALADMPPMGEGGDIGDMAGMGDMGAGGMPAPGGEGGSQPPMASFGSGFDPADYPDPASWRIAPEPIPADQITATYDADVVIVGHGHYGINCARYLCDNSSKSVILIEQQGRDTLSVLGHEWTQLNSQFGFEHGGFSEIDPAEFTRNWALFTANMHEPGLIANYANYSGPATDQFLQDLTDEDVACVTYGFHEYEDIMLHEVGPFKFYYSCLSMDNGLSLAKIHGYNREACEAKGAQFFFEMKGEQLVKDESGRVTGVIAADTANGGYVQFNANCAVVLATGGFGGNGNMCLDLLGDLAEALAGGEMMSAMMDYSGDGIRMGYWAGGRLQYGPIATMNGRQSSPGSPQMVWLDASGQRFCDEYFPSVELRGRPVMRKPRDVVYNVYDATYPDNLTKVLPQHMVSAPTEESIQAARDAIDAAYAAGAEGVDGVFAADTLDELFDYVGMDPEVKARAITQIEEYNGYCETGSDLQFGRAPEVLFPVATPPFVCKTGKASVGRMMVTTGGLETDGNCRVLDAEFQPIPGLFAGGNCGGNRFGYDYFTPGPGVSIGSCIALGYATGKFIAENL